jgi:transposase
MQAQAIVGPVSHPRTKRQYRSVEERRRIVEETLVPGVSVAEIARAHGINANQVFGWRKLYHAGVLGVKDLSSSEALQSAVHLLPVVVSAEAEQAPQQLESKAADAAVSCSGSIELIFAKARVRISGQVDTALLRLILESLRG